jgi:hypothetical protein
MLRSLSERIDLEAPRTLSAPSNLPPVGWVSRWLPIITGERIVLAFGRANMLPISSTVTEQPAASHHFRNSLRD